MKNNKIIALKKAVVRELDKLPNDEKIELPIDILEKVVFTVIPDKDKEGNLIYVKSIALSNEHLRKLDLSQLDFTNVDVLGFNFEGTNANINPQLVYNKNFCATNVRGLNMSEYDFTDVDITLADLRDTGAKIDLDLIRNGSIRGTKLDDDSLVERDIKVITDKDIKRLEEIGNNFRLVKKRVKDVE